METTPFIHDTAVVESGVEFGRGVKIWHYVQIRSGAKLGDLVSIGKDSYVDAGVRIGRGSRIQNRVDVFGGVHIHDWVFVGPSVVFTNDQFPRVGNKSWTKVDTHVMNGSSIGAGAVIRCGVTLGPFSMIGAGAIVTKDVPPFTLVVGHPAGEVRKICACGQTPLSKEPAAWAGYLLACCEANMSPETLELARSEIIKLSGV